LRDKDPNFEKVTCSNETPDPYADDPEKQKRLYNHVIRLYMDM